MIELKQTNKITFSIDNKTIEFYTANKWEAEGDFNVFVGGSSAKHCRWIFNILTK
jgi:beta-glucosidase